MFYFIFILVLMSKCIIYLLLFISISDILANVIVDLVSNNNHLDTGLCNNNQTVIVKMSSSYNIFKNSKARISSNYEMESPQSVHLYVVVRSFLYYFVNLETSIALLKTKQYFLKSTLTKREETN